MSNKEFNGKFEPLQSGDYLVRMIQLDEKESTKGDAMLTARFQVVSGPEGVDGAKGRIIFENFMVTHSNPKAVAVSMAKLRNYANAVGIRLGKGESIEDNIDKIGDFLETPFIATLGTKPEFNGKIENTIVEYKAR